MVAAIIIGGMTAWYLGVRSGVVAAVVTVIALVVASFFPALTVTVYALVIAWVAALYFWGSKIASGVGGPDPLGGRLLSRMTRAVKRRERRR